MSRKRPLEQPYAYGIEKYNFSFDTSVSTVISRPIPVESKSITESESLSQLVISISSTYDSICIECEESSFASLDITNGLSCLRIEEVHELLDSQRMVVYFNFKYSSDTNSCTLVLYFNLHLSVSSLEFYYLDTLRWCYGDSTLRPPWMDIYSSSYPDTTILPNHADEIARKLLEDISTCRTDSEVPLAELQSLEEELIRLGLTTKLRRYQLCGILWLKNHLNFTFSVDPPDVLSYGTIDGWMPLLVEDGSNHKSYVWYCLSTGELNAVKPTQHITVSGGILADYMGLGKSIQILGLLLLSRRRSRGITSLSLPFTSEERNLMNDKTSQVTRSNAAHACSCGNRKLHYSSPLLACKLCGKLRHVNCMETLVDSSDYCCFDCVCRICQRQPLHSAASLLIVPRGLISQWIGEVRKHIASSEDGSEGLKVFVYDGISKTMAAQETDPSAALSIDPRRLASCDVVIVALDVLKEEIHHTADKGSTMSSRHAKVYSRSISPLLCIDWSMLIVDETQKIEGETNASRMSMLLNGRHRYVLSGTPMGHSKIDDLQYLLKFLRVSPFEDASIWKGLFTFPMEASSSASMNHTAIYDKLLFLLKSLMLRRRKEDVEHELHSTTQDVDIKMLTLSSFEQMEYDSTQNYTLTQVRRAPQSRDRHVEKTLHEIDFLRKSSCHPQAFAKASKFSSLSFEDIIVSKVEKLGVEMEDIQRRLVFNLTGLAGCLQLLHSTALDGGQTAEATKHLTIAANAYLIALKNMELHREVTDIIAIGTISDDNGALRIGASKFVRADKMQIVWQGKLVKLDATTQTTNDNFDYDKFMPFLSSSCEVEASHAVNPTTLDVSNAFACVSLSAKIEFASGKRVNEVLIACNIRAFFEQPLSPEKLHVLVFPSLVALQAGLMQVSLDVHLPLPLVLDRRSGTYRIQDWESSSVAQDGIRSKLFTLKAQSVHSTCLVIRMLGDVAQVMVSSISMLDRLADCWNMPLSISCRITAKIRGALYDCDPFQELHVRENLRNVLTTLHAEGLHTLKALASISDLNAGDQLTKALDQQPIESQDRVQPIATSSASASTSSIAEAETRVSISCSDYASALATTCTRIRDVFVQRAYHRRLIGGSDLQTIFDKIKAKRDAVDESMPKWWERLLELVVKNPEFVRLGGALLVDIKAAVARGQLAYVALSHVCSSQHLLEALRERYIALHRSRGAILLAFKKLSTKPSENEVLETSNCKLCCESHGKSGPVCSHCKLQERMFEYSQMLFAFKRKVKRLRQVNNQQQRQGLDGDGVFEQQELHEYEVDGVVVMLLREVRRFINASVHQNLLALMDTHELLCIRQAAKHEDEALALMQQEMKTLNSLWSNHQMLLFSYDELDQAVGTVKLIDVEQYTRLSNTAKNGYITKFELKDRCAQDYLLALEADAELRFNSSKMRFMRFEARERKDGQQECVICQCDLENDIRLLPCLHCFHHECILRWLANKKRCPLCQTSVSNNDLTVVENAQSRRGSQPTVKIVGDFGTKLNVVVGDLLRLLNDTDEKAIVFSQWTEVLQILATALKKNGIKHACCYNAKDLSSSKKSTAQAPLDKFKHDLNIRVLLIPLVLGADGLSIIEATHVFLLEPLVNPSTELQAIARVARIGQTRPTHVHKYILTKTIEERIHRAAQANAGQTESISGKSPMKKRVGDKNAVSIDLLEELYSNN